MPAGRRPVGPWANGRRQGVPIYVSVAPLAPGGLTARLGPRGWRGGPPAARDAAWMHKETDLPVRCTQVGNMEVRREYRT